MHRFVLETERLTLRCPTPDDAEDAFVWLSDPEVNRYMPYNLYESVEQVRAWLQTVADDDGMKFHFAFVRKSDGRVIGSGDVSPNEAGDVWETGYNLRRDCWNQGYTTEALRAMLRFAHDVFGVHEFGATHAIANPASGRVMEHCGMRFDHFNEYGRFDGSETFPAKYYRLHMD